MFTSGGNGTHYAYSGRWFFKKVTLRLSRFNLIITYVVYHYYYYYYYVFPKTCSDFYPSVYAFQRQPRLDKLYFNSEHYSFESICAVTSDFSFSAYSVLAIVLQDNQSIFLADCQDILENLATNHSEFYILVNLSLNLDIPSSSTTTFDHILPSFDLNNSSPVRQRCTTICVALHSDKPFKFNII